MTLEQIMDSQVVNTIQTGLLITGGAVGSAIGGAIIGTNIWDKVQPGYGTAVEGAYRLLCSAVTGEAIYLASIIGYYVSR